MAVFMLETPVIASILFLQKPAAWLVSFILFLIKSEFP